jgi:hypothetical protein
VPAVGPALRHHYDLGVGFDVVFGGNVSGEELELLEEVRADGLEAGRKAACFPIVSVGVVELDGTRCGAAAIGGDQAGLDANRDDVTGQAAAERRAAAGIIRRHDPGSEADESDFVAADRGEIFNFTLGQRGADLGVAHIQPARGRRPHLDADGLLRQPQGQIENLGFARFEREFGGAGGEIWGFGSQAIFSGGQREKNVEAVGSGDEAAGGVGLKVEQSDLGAGQ